MRLVFLFSAEERDLLLLGDPLYDEHYAVSTLRGQAAGSGRPARRGGAGAPARCLGPAARRPSGRSTAGSGTSGSSCPPYGGKLFDPDRFPFLEGRKPGTTWKDTPGHAAAGRQPHGAAPARGRSSTSKMPGGGEARRLSFRALDIEQIGHVYEGLLDHTAKRATEPCSA